MSEQKIDPGLGKNYWRSLQELAESEEFRRHLEQEFPAGVEVPALGLDRRRFLQIMAASVAMTGLAGCSWPEEKIVPFAHRPAGTVPGRTKLFSTACEIGGIAVPLAVTSFDGRPIKVDGNPEHPLSGGAASARLQATVLGLYDPDRSRNVIRRDGRQRVPSRWDDLLRWLEERRSALASDGLEVAVLAEPSSSPSRRALQERLLRAFPRTAWYEHAAVPDDAELAGIRQVFGRPLRALPDLGQARVIVDFDADLLHDHATALCNARRFAARRRPERGWMNRLYVFEPTPTMTGAMADHRVPLPASEVRNAVFALVAELVVNQELALPDGSGPTADELRPYVGHAAHSDTIVALARDLLDHRGEALLMAGTRQPAEVHAACQLLNAALGGIGRTVVYLPVESSTRGPALGLAELTSALRERRVGLLLILGGDPVYTAPADVDFAAALEAVEHAIYLGGREDATAALCRWHVNRAHYLESWGDLRAPDGSLLAVQPLIAPLYEGRTDLELLSALVDPAPRRSFEIVRATFYGTTGGRGDVPDGDPAFEKRWRTFLHDGFLAGSAAAPETPRATASGSWNLGAPNEGRRGAENLELVIAPSPALYDGRFANNAWLQELPDFMTKLTWGNAALLGPATARDFGVDDGDEVELFWRDRTLALPVYVLPGQARDCVTIQLGYGREDVGRVGNGVGANAYALRTSNALYGGDGLRLRATGERRTLASTQDHHAIDRRGAQERQQRIGGLVGEADLEHYLDHPEFVDHLGIHHPPLTSLWKEWGYTGHKWGMTIDLNVCIGCNACVIACQAENNIPVVGSEEVERGREMHWMRVDRYFRGAPDDPTVAHQPMACAQCELAPCETVCPVAATVHTSEGLNAMVYNRCVGTRYCSNNCPYKVRRFNWFDNVGPLTETEKMVLNPDVTVRSRGVMEKCTYCVQRIEHARINAKNERRSIADGEIIPACQQTCPTEAIVFGDLNDSDSRVSRLRAEKRAYDVLAYLNIKPRTSYLARIRNPNPELAAAAHGEQHDDGGEGARGEHGDHGAGGATPAEHDAG
jgi:molybdopterin-containing oxidoreductase family iron-sulfur binding subunit